MVDLFDETPQHSMNFSKNVEAITLEVLTELSVLLK